MTTKGCLISGFIASNLVFWAVAIVVSRLAHNDDFTALLALLSALEGLVIMVGACVYMVVLPVRELVRFMEPIHFLLFAAWIPGFGVYENLTLLHADPPRDFYGVVAGTGAALLIAYSIDAALPTGQPSTSLRKRRGILVGTATGITVAIGAPLAALARVDGGTRVLCGLALGGLLMGIVMLLASLAQRASSAIAAEAEARV